MLEKLGPVTPSPEGRPCCTTVSRPENLTVGVPGVECSHHDGSRSLGVDSNSTESEVEIIARDRCDVRP